MGRKRNMSLPVIAARLAAEADPKSAMVPEPLRDIQARLRAAQEEYESAKRPRVLVVQGSNRNENTCPQESPKSLRLCGRAIEVLGREGCDADLLDLSRMTSEKGRVIWPCKGCFSTSPALCHVGCSCYPNGALGQEGDWMQEEIYEMLVRSHAIFVITPTYWFSMPSSLKLMIDRMVCLDGANWDPTTTLSDDGSTVKDVEKAKSLERGPKPGGEPQWDYISGKALLGRLFTVFVHGDAAGTDTAFSALRDTLAWFGMHEVSGSNGYIGYEGTYSDSHDHLDEDEGSWAQVEMQAKDLAAATKAALKGGMPHPPLLPNKFQK